MSYSDDKTLDDLWSLATGAAAGDGAFTAASSPGGGEGGPGTVDDQTDTMTMALPLLGQTQQHPRQLESNGLQRYGQKYANDVQDDENEDDDNDDELLPGEAAFEDVVRLLEEAVSPLPRKLSPPGMYGV